MGAFPSGQRGQTVNLLSVTSVVRIHPLPPKKKRNFDTKLRFFVFAQNRLNKGFLKKEKFYSEFAVQMLKNVIFVI